MNVLGEGGATRLLLVKSPSTWEKRLLFLVGEDRGWLLEEVSFELTLDGWFSCVRRNGSGKIVGTGSCEESWGRIWTLFYSHWGITEQFYRKECHVQTCVSECQMDAGNVKHGHHLHSALYLTKGFHSCRLILSSNVSINEVGFFWFFFFNFPILQRGKTVSERLEVFFIPMHLTHECRDKNRSFGFNICCSFWKSDVFLGGCCSQLAWRWWGVTREWQ